MISVPFSVMHLNFNKAAKVPRAKVECDLQLLGLVAMENRIKPVTLGVINQLNRARIRTVMVTGDNLLTAMSVARECGIVRPNKRAFLVEHCLGEVDVNGRTKIAVNQSVSSSGDILDDDSVIVKNVKDAELGQPIQSSYHLAISGPTFAVITHEYPELLDSLVTVCDVFARMAPDQKQQLINCLQEIGYTVAMCGDGANDCAALKAAAGISLSDAEASIAAPFTSKVADIRCVPTIISEGRAALVTSFGIFKYMAGYSLTQFVAVMLLYYISNFLTDGQFMYIDMFLITLLAVLFGNTAAYENLCPTPPPKRLLSVASICSVLGQLAIMGSTQLLVFLMTTTQPWFVPYTAPRGSDTEDKRSLQGWCTMPRKDSESSSSTHEESHREDESLSSDVVVNKYQMAAQMANEILKKLISEVKEGVEVGNLCTMGDTLIQEKTSKVFVKEKDVTKGIAMPTCISVDHCTCHYSPLRSDPSVILKNGQMVKVTSLRVALVAEEKQLQQIDLDSNFPVVAASIVDPYVALLTQNGRLMLFHLVLNPVVHLQEIDISNTAFAERTVHHRAPLTALSIYRDMSGLMVCSQDALMPEEEEDKKEQEARAEQFENSSIQFRSNERVVQLQIVPRWLLLAVCFFLLTAPSFAQFVDRDYKERSSKTNSANPTFHQSAPPWWMDFSTIGFMDFMMNAVVHISFEIIQIFFWRVYAFCKDVGTYEVPTNDEDIICTEYERHQLSHDGESTEEKRAPGDAIIGESAYGANTNADTATGESMRGESTNGDKIKGDNAFGIMMKGERQNGERTRGVRTTGDKMNGVRTNGDRTKGTKAPGERIKGSKANGDKTAVDSRIGEITTGESKRGEMITGTNAHGERMTEPKIAGE
ncbi:unnamed protein product [Cylicocyclus nassatus]|uniref:RSE1/DDB1/CPSF1 second beta-propeller domain-containing protein n=1 Tax=Cylicocyclus nassatus TaxID=53992 RepID=A0AA36HCA6_CYLNA|nr:unnamed protein product [Cylicocyclus nassatus]